MKRGEKMAMDKEGGREGRGGRGRWGIEGDEKIREDKGDGRKGGER